MDATHAKILADWLEERGGKLAVDFIDAVTGEPKGSGEYPARWLAEELRHAPAWVERRGDAIVSAQNELSHSAYRLPPDAPA